MRCERKSSPISFMLAKDQAKGQDEDCKTISPPYNSQEMANNHREPYVSHVT